MHVAVLLTSPWFLSGQSQIWLYKENWKNFKNFIIFPDALTQWIIADGFIWIVFLGDCFTLLFAWDTISHSVSLYVTNYTKRCMNSEDFELTAFLLACFSYWALDNNENIIENTFLAYVKWKTCPFHSFQKSNPFEYQMSVATQLIILYTAVHECKWGWHRKPAMH